jgi:hypothetical protein
LPADREWGVRLADVRLPTFWWLAVLITFLFSRRLQRRQLRELQRIGAELGTYIGERDRAAAEREDRLIKLTWALLALTGATLAVAVVTIVQS